MRILFLSDNFLPEVNAPASRTFDHCREWVKAGAESHCGDMCAQLHARQGLSGYKNKLWQTEMMDGIRVIRVWYHMVPNKGLHKAHSSTT